MNSVRAGKKSRVLLAEDTVECPRHPGEFTRQTLRTIRIIFLERQVRNHCVVRSFENVLSCENCRSEARSSRPRLASTTA